MNANNKRHHDLQLGIVLLVATLCVAFFTMAALSNFKLGLHFDKDMRVITEVSDHVSMQNFVRSKQTMGHETDLAITQNNIAILNISGVDNSEAFMKDMLNSVPSAKVLLQGNFGSMTKFLNNHSFISISLLVVCLVIVLYQVTMYRMYGWYKALEAIFIMMVPLFILTELGYAFSISVWYTLFALVLMQLLVSEHYQDNEMMRWFLGGGIGVLGLMLLVAQIERFYAVAFLLLAASFVSLLFTLAYRFLFNPLLTPYRLMISQEDKKLLKPSTDGVYARIKIMTVLVLGVALVLLLTMARGQYKVNSEDRGYFKELVIFQSDTTNYLEIQALLSRVGLFDEQMSYLVSEQGQTWIEFSAQTSIEDLRYAQKALVDEFNIHSVYFDGIPSYNYFNTQTFNILILAICIAVGAFYSILYENKTVLFYLFEILISLVIYVCLIHRMNLHNNQVWLLGLLVIPLIYTLIKVDMEKQKTASYYFDSLITSGVMMIILALPIFVIVPSAVSAELIFYFLILLIAIYLSIAFGSLIQLAKGRFIDESTTT